MRNTTVRFLRMMMPRSSLRRFMRQVRLYSSKAAESGGGERSYRLLVVGGGSGGIATAAKFASKLGKGKVGVLEPHDTHCYQPLWTLVGGGIKQLSSSFKPMADVMPSQADWIQDAAETFSPQENTVVTKQGLKIKYDFLVVAMGIQVRFDLIDGLMEALETPYVCSNYSYNTVTKTHRAMQALKEGNAIFTYPATPIKCPGAAQKIMYITDAYLRKVGRRDKVDIIFNTSLGVIFGVRKYADALWDVVKGRGIAVNLKHELVQVRPAKREAVFRLLGSTADPKETVTFKYNMLHVVPPMMPSAVINTGPSFADAAGYLDVDGETLQHKRYPNVFGIGDCTNVPTSKTAAAVAGEIGILRRNLTSVMEGKAPTKKYNGYTSCPLVTSYDKCILAEFDSKSEPLETFPFNQAKERTSMFYMKRDILPFIYWNLFLRGYWEGPGIFRKALHLGFSK
ncbi:sulfide:quinone oxidoreductase, mitochondrial isoform X3 [Dermacentor albipictus]|uniref:sulfide:quinone oxidoreductase, mitochondrial isoform X3 n=1 Tax=Dermacentor albipictus TaxID=60249 RepID=UPI0038FC4F46